MIMFRPSVRVARHNPPMNNLELIRDIVSSRSQKKVKDHLEKLGAGGHYLRQLIGEMDECLYKLTEHNRYSYYLEIIGREGKSELIETFAERIQVMLFWEDSKSKGEKFPKVKISAPNLIDNRRYVNETLTMLIKVFKG